MINILITGSRGQLGSEFNDLQTVYPQYRFLLVDRDGLDITHAEKVNELFSSFEPHYCINCAAYTAVDKAESDWDAAYAVNVAAVGTLATACAIHNTRFVHISTDYVFNGQADTPYTEDAPTEPVNAYGRSKLLGEQAALEANDDAIIIRTSWVYSSYGSNFVKTMLRLMQSRPEINVVADQQGSPTYAADLAEAIMYIIEKEVWCPGIYHYTNDGIISWHQFAQAIQELTGSACTVHPIATAQYPTLARRPAYSGLSKERIISLYGVPLKPWRESLQTCLQKIKP